MVLEKKIVLGLTVIVGLGLTPFVTAHQSGESNQAREIMESHTSCSQITDDQLAQIGKYYIEHMSSEAAERTMDRYDSEENTRQMHIQVAEESYCSNNGYYHHPHHSDYGHHSYWRWPGGGIVDYFTDIIWGR